MMQYPGYDALRERVELERAATHYQALGFDFEEALSVARFVREQYKRFPRQAPSLSEILDAHRQRLCRHWDHPSDALDATLAEVHATRTEYAVWRLLEAQ